jgi:hypothetical protein
MEQISVIYHSFFIWARVLIILSLAAIIFIHISLKYGTSIKNFILWFFERFITIIVFFILHLFTVFVRFQLAKGKSHFQNISKSENYMTDFLLKIKDAQKNKTNTTPIGVRIKRYRLLAFSIVLIYTFSLAFLPSTWISATWIKTENWIIYDVIEMPFIKQEAASKRIWTGYKKSDSKPVQGNVAVDVTLRDNYKHGDVKEKPSSASKLVYKVKPGDVLVYIGEDVKDNRNLNWRKVKTPDGKTGWIPSKFIKQKK